MAEIWVLTIRPNGNDGGSLGFTARTEADITAKLASYCRANWQEKIGGTMPSRDAAIISRYFEWCEDESADMAPADLDDA